MTLPGSKFIKVDTVYDKPHSELKPSDWPAKYVTKYENIFAVGIAFAPPGSISEPITNPNGVKIVSVIPRTGYPSELTAKAVAKNIAAVLKGKEPKYTARFNEIGAPCVASIAEGPMWGAAISLGVYPFIKDYEKYPEYGRDMKHTFMEMGWAGGILKRMLNVYFMWKLSGKPFWSLLP